MSTKAGLYVTGEQIDAVATDEKLAYKRAFPLWPVAAEVPHIGTGRIAARLLRSQEKALTRTGSSVRETMDAAITV